VRLETILITVGDHARAILEHALEMIPMEPRYQPVLARVERRRR
jgi:hypothetical protein